MHLINKAVECGSLTDPDNGQVNTPSGTTFGSTAVYTCNMGYVLSHQQTVMCSSNGMWSPASPSCNGENTTLHYSRIDVIHKYYSLSAVNCGPLTNPNNGQVDTSPGTIFESTATYTCDTGYILSGSQSRTCGADGMWTSTEPTCSG